MNAVMDHIALNVEDAEAMVDFYSHVLGLPPERLEAYRAGDVAFPSVRLSPDTIIDLFPKAMWSKEAKSRKGRANLNHLCLAASQREWAAVRRRLEAAAIPIETGPVPRWGARGTGTSIYFRDPEGNLVEVRYYEKGTAKKPCLLGS